MLQNKSFTGPRNQTSPWINSFYFRRFDFSLKKRGNSILIFMLELKGTSKYREWLLSYARLDLYFLSHTYVEDHLHHDGDIRSHLASHSD